MNNLFGRFFRKKKPVNVDARTIPLSEEQLKGVTIQDEHMQPPQLAAACSQSVGKQREHNEDTIFSMTAILADGLIDLPFGLFIVADGMGGHENGELASNCAVRVMSKYLLERLANQIIGQKFDSDGETVQEILENGVREAQQAVLRDAPGGGTTLTAALTLGELVTFAHVGDSRAYFIYKDGRIQVMTQDHSLVHRLVELNQISEAEALIHPRRNVLYRALGQTEPFRPDIQTVSVPRPGCMLLCSDGLWGVVPDMEILRIVNSASTPMAACNALVSAANAAGGPDNISVVLCRYLD